MSENIRRIRCFASIILSLTLVASCSSKRSELGPESSAGSKVVSSTPPFKTREPNHYKATRSLTFVPSPSGEPVIVKTVIVKNGEMRREEEGDGSKRIVYLDLPSGRFLLLPEAKLYASLDQEAVKQDLGDAETDPPGELYLHTGPINSVYENVGREKVNGRVTTKYRVIVNSSGVENVTTSETLIWIDETLGMPIKSTTTSNGGVRTIELSELSLEVDTSFFQIPPDYQKVDVSSLRQRINAR